MELKFRVHRVCDGTGLLTPLSFRSSVSKIGCENFSNRRRLNNVASVRNGKLNFAAGSSRPLPKDSTSGEMFVELEFKQKIDLDPTMESVRDSSALNYVEKTCQTSEEEKGFAGFEKFRLRRGRQVMRRCNMLAKQLISIESALSLGFVSQLWVDTTSWAVVIVEARPNLLSGESEKFLLQDVSQVGDVVLVEDETVLENEFKMVGLDTLVGYRVVTPGRRNIGKVRGYTFNINSGAVESLELDSFGISIIPSTLVSTYALLVEDVLEVVSDMVVVHEAAALHIQRLTKGLWDNQNTRNSMDDLGEDFDSEKDDVYDYGRAINSHFRGQQPRPKMRETEDDWELPMDFV